VAAGRPAQAEEALRVLLATGDAPPATGWMNLSIAVALQGRRAEGFEVLDTLEGRTDAAKLSYLRANYLAGDSNPEPVRREALKVSALDAGLASDLVVVLEYLGDAEGARRLASVLKPGSVAEETYQALIAFHHGDRVTAVARLAALEQKDPWPVGCLVPSFLLAEVSAAAGDHREVIAAVRRFHGLWPRGMWRSWAYPRSIILAAQAHEALGQRELARTQIDRLLDMWRRADPGLPLLRQARVLRALIPIGVFLAFGSS
jgi:eukaryotic-like serine/threonine-protein kinase